MKSVLQNLEFDPAVELPSVLFVVIAGKWPAFPVSYRLDPPRVDALLRQVIFYRLGALL